MKKRLFKSVAFSLIGLSSGLVSVRAQVFVHPVHLTGTARFSNNNPAILSLLNAPGNEGMSNIIVIADSLPPTPPFSATSDYLLPTSRTSADYDIVVESDAGGIAYRVTPTILMQGQLYDYWFNNLTSAPVLIGTPPPPLDFTECLGVVTVEFVTSGGAPVAVDGGKIICYDATTYAYTGIRSDMPAGITSQRIYLRGGQTHQIDVSVHRGTNFYADRIDAFLSTNVLVTCDQFSTIQMVVPDPGSVATISGTVDMLGKFELTVAGNKTLEYPDWTSVIARYGPFNNQRWGALDGTNFTAPSSGTYTLGNVVPSDSLSPGYEVYAQMAFGSNRTIQIFQTPALGSGSNAALAVSPGASIDLGNTFQINPGFMRGRLLFQGPSEGLGRASLFRGVLHAGDDSTDGIPNYMGTYGVYWSVIEADGVDRLASGASFTASSGLGYGDFDGAFNPATSAYEGQYELALGGLKGENSLWKQDYLTLVLASGAITNDDDYYYNILTVAEQQPAETEIAPGQVVNHDVGYCFGEVKIVFRSTEGTFYSPQVRGSVGTFTNIDFQNHPANYRVDVGAAFGTPNTPATASNVGQVVMYLPEGHYELHPSVVPGTGLYAITGLEPLDVTVGCGEQIAFEPCLQLTLNSPNCTSPLVHISGSVRSCTNNVTSISYSLNGGPTQTICANCGVNPSFAFSLLLTTECQDNTLTVTATDASGGISSVTRTIHYDTTPPVIHCPADIVASACDTNGVVVNYTVTATDNCSGPVAVVSTPPSGSVFPVGTTTVTSTATDACGNSSQCQFKVIVGGAQLTIERAIIIRWNCGGTLQEADNITGPWTDIPGATSPYAVATTAQRKFYRVRN